MNIKILLLVLSSLFCTSAFASLEAGSGSMARTKSGDTGTYSLQAGICYQQGNIVSFKKCRKPQNGYDEKRLTLCIDISKPKGDFPGLMEQQWQCAGSGEIYMGGKSQESLCYNECLKYFLKNRLG